MTFQQVMTTFRAVMVIDTMPVMINIIANDQEQASIIVINYCKDMYSRSDIVMENCVKTDPTIIDKRFVNFVIRDPVIVEPEDFTKQVSK